MTDAIQHVWEIRAELEAEARENLAGAVQRSIAGGVDAKLRATERGWPSALEVASLVMRGQMLASECQITIRQTLIPHWDKFQLQGLIRDGGHIVFRPTERLPGQGGGAS